MRKSAELGLVSLLMKFIRIICFLLISSFSAELLANACFSLDGMECCMAKEGTDKDDDVKKEKEEKAITFGSTVLQFHIPLFSHEYQTASCRLNNSAYLFLPEIPPDQA